MEFNWFGVRKLFVLLVFGSVLYRLGKCWKVEYFGDFVMKLCWVGVMLVIFGIDVDKDVVFVI